MYTRSPHRTLFRSLAHTPSGGNVILRVTAPAVLEVEDDGPGIPLHERDRVFERFYRRNQQVAGSGLGLAIVGEICRAHLARITLHDGRSEEHTSELQSLMRTSYAVFCLTKQT